MVFLLTFSYVSNFLLLKARNLMQDCRNWGKYFLCQEIVVPFFLLRERSRLTQVRGWAGLGFCVAVAPGHHWLPMPPTLPVDDLGTAGPEEFLTVRFPLCCASDGVCWETSPFHAEARTLKAIDFCVTILYPKFPILLLYWIIFFLSVILFSFPSIWSYNPKTYFYFLSSFYASNCFLLPYFVD